jgi:hypothetical protein
MMTYKQKNLSLIYIATSSLLFSNFAMADGASIDKIYHPYVDALEKELEYRVLVQDEQTDLYTSAQIHQLALGTSFSDRWFGEAYIIGEKSRDGNFEIEAYELELKWQLTEQGEYFADWGLLFEYETETEVDVEEFSVALLSEKEWGRWSGTANLFLVQEWGGDIDDELESILSLQARYRYSSSFEPGLEFYAGQTATGLGPVIQGDINTGIRKKLHWEAGYIFGLDSESPDQSLRFLVEFEF